MSVKLATQVFSLSVSAAIKTAVATGQLPSSALDTAHFLERINNIFDVMNSSKKFSTNPYKCAISSSSNSHLQTPLLTLSNSIRWVKSLQMVKDKRPPCMDSFEHTLLATSLLWVDIKAEGAKYLLTGRINQDPIENEFSVARQKCGFERNPSVRLFRQNLRHRIQAALIQPPAGANCEPDEDELLSTVTGDVEPQCSFSLSCQPATLTSVPPEEHDLTPSDSDSEEDEIGSLTTSLESCSVRYFTGYGVRACLRKFNCANCRKDMLKLPSGGDIYCPEEALIQNREYRDDRLHLLYPNDETTKVVDSVLSTLSRILKSKIHTIGFKNMVLLRCKRRTFKEHPDWMRGGTECYKHREFVMDKIVTAKIKRTLQSMSKDLRQPGGKYRGHWEKMMKLKNK